MDTYPSNTHTIQHASWPAEFRPNRRLRIMDNDAEEEIPLPRKRDVKRSGHGYTMFVAENSDDDDDDNDVDDDDVALCGVSIVGATSTATSGGGGGDDVKNTNAKLKKHS